MLSQRTRRQPLASPIGVPDREPVVPSFRLPMRFRSIGLLLSGAVVASSACSEDATAPSPNPSFRAASAPATWSGSDRSIVESGLMSAPGNAANGTTYVVTIDPQRSQQLHFGAYTLDLPGNAICDRGSGYGLDAFNLDCKTEKDAVTITALVTSKANGIPRIDLLPEMRFNPKRVVTLSLFVADAPTPASSPRILYCPSASTPCIDEALLDPTLATQVDAAGNTVFRRIKHFSGYFVEW